MGAIDQLLIWGIDPRGNNGIEFQEPIATQGHEAFDLYSRQVTLGDSTALSLPSGVEGLAWVKDGGDSGVFTVYADGTVDLLASTSGVTAPGGGGDIQIGDIASDDSAQIRNDSGTDGDFTAVLLYR